jgi:hypothetical protein
VWAGRTLCHVDSPRPKPGSARQRGERIAQELAFSCTSLRSLRHSQSVMFNFWSCSRYVNNRRS